MEERRITINGRSINYIRAGSGAPLLLLHGGTFGWRMWYKNIPDLAKYFTVYAMDLPGAGYSSPLNYRTMDFKKDFLDVTTGFIEQAGIAGTHVIGHSFGGWIAATIAAENAAHIGKLVLTDSVGFGNRAAPPDFLISFYPFAQFLSKTILRPAEQNALLEKILLRGPFYNKDTELAPEFIRHCSVIMRKHHNLLFISRLIARRKELDLRDVLSKITNTTLIVWGERDPIIPLKQCALNFTRIPNAKTEILPDTGHVPPLEASNRFNTLIMDFLNQ